MAKRMGPGPVPSNVKPSSQTLPNNNVNTNSENILSRVTLNDCLQFAQFFGPYTSALWHLQGNYSIYCLVSIWNDFSSSNICFSLVIEMSSYHQPFFILDRLLFLAI